MTSPVIVPKAQRLFSPKTGYDLLEEKKQDSGEPSDKMFTFDGRFERPLPSVQEASLEVERILLALEDSERDQKSPLPENPRDTYVQHSPPLRAISPPARSQNPQAETMEALWREQTEVDSDECLPSAGQHVFDEYPDHEEEDEMPAIEQFQFTTQRSSTTTQRPPIQSFTEPSSPYSAPLLPLGINVRRNSLSPGDEDDDEDVDIVFISPPNEFGFEQTPSAMISEDTPEELPVEPGSCPLSIQVTDPPLSMRRFQSLPGSGPSSGPSSATNSSFKRKRGKPKYESRSLPITVGCDLVLTMQRRQVRTMSDTLRQSVAC